MYNSFSVKSIRGEYHVNFVDDFAVELAGNVAEGDVIFIDKNIVKLYSNKINSFTDQNKYIAIEPTESLKSYQGIETFIDNLINRGFRKNNKLIAIGGGITQDVTAFIASILFRGVDWVFFPTTLLAQCDSCIGSKTSINFNEHKNQIGGFYPPSSIFIDLKFLDTLSSLDIQSGLGEMAHYYLVSGKGDYKIIKENYEEAMINRSVLKRLVFRSLEIKKAMIEIDEYDKGPRNVFNYGHTFGHAIESITDYGIPHGIAVSYGMDIANYISARMHYISDELRYDIREFLEMIWCDTTFPKIDIREYANVLLKDKKVVGKQLNCILTKGLGSMFKTPLELDDKTLGWIEHCLEDYSSK